MSIIPEDTHREADSSKRPIHLQILLLLQTANVTSLSIQTATRLQNVGWSALICRCVSSKISRQQDRKSDVTTHDDTFLWKAEQLCNYITGN
jgi:hypothetical protein